MLHHKQKDKKYKHRSDSSNKCHDVDLSRSIVIPAGQCDVSGECINRNLCCDVDQQDARYKACPIDKRKETIHLKLRPQAPKAKQGKIEVNVKLDKKNLNPGVAHIKGPDVNIGGKKYVIDIHPPKKAHCKPDVKVNCQDGKIKMSAPRIDYQPGCVEVGASEMYFRYFDECGKVVKVEKKKVN